MKKVKVAIIDDDSSYRDSLKVILEKDERIKIYGEYSSAEEFISSINPSFKPDVCLMDIVMKKMSGIECSKQVKEQFPEMHFIIMTAYPDAESFAEAGIIKADYVEKGTCIESLINKIITSKASSKSSKKSRVVSLKENKDSNLDYLELAKELEEARRKVTTLSKGQIEVLRLRKDGKSIKEIAALLNVTVGTVHTHIVRAKKKLKLPDLMDYIL